MIFNEMPPFVPTNDSLIIIVFCISAQIYLHTKYAMLFISTCSRNHLSNWCNTKCLCKSDASINKSCNESCRCCEMNICFFHLRYRRPTYYSVLPNASIYHCYLNNNYPSASRDLFRNLILLPHSVYGSDACYSRVSKQWIEYCILKLL